MKRTWKFWLGLVALFLLGMLLGGMIGAAAVQQYVKKLAVAPRGDLQEMVLADWKKKLSLRDEQVTALRPVLSSAEEKIVPLRDQFLVNLNGILTELHPKVRAVLDSKQQKKYDEMAGRHEQKIGLSSPAQEQR